MNKAQYERCKKKADDTLNYLASCPNGITSVETQTLKILMLQTSGRMFACGYQYDIVAKSLGAGVYQLRLKRVND